MVTRLKRFDVHSKVLLQKVIPGRIPRDFFEPSLISQRTIYSTVTENAVTSTQNLHNIPRDASEICVVLIRKKRYI